jgi:protein-tyrosine-phosphatase/DNA-binding transcriptional ArsR family regulator
MPAAAAYTQPPAILKLLAHDLRWQLVAALARGDARGHELAERVGRPPNLVSYHLRRLASHGVVHPRRSAADGRDVYFQLDLDRVGALYQTAGAALHPAFFTPNPAGILSTRSGRRRPLRVLFLCTHNSARSQMAEALLRQAAGAQVQVHSAGTQPSVLHPLAVETLAAQGMDLGGQHSKHVDVFAGQSFDLVITVCDRAREACPAFPGAREQLHWSFPDPTGARGVLAQRRAFAEVAAGLGRRVHYLLPLIVPA